MKNRILILEDESIIANGIKLYLDRHKYFCDVALGPERGKVLVERYKYTAMICDINLEADITGIEFARRYANERTPIVFLTAYNDLSTMKQAELASPYAYVTKPFDKDHLLITLNLAVKNCRKKFFYSPSDDVDVMDIDLSDREIEITKLLAKSKTTNEISELLCISPHTVATHRKNIIRKTGVKSLVELVSLAVEKGWV